ncbi:hypothetical protein [Pseudomonas rustica]|uniref:hypothetical protein n=1 Tax=Pseudomonas rustica TaxID=2827099 RepID=UPI001BB0B3FE|nr:hypothetical protein [Pseudomonas rustica]MBS4090405.1 hypothetical protein [Pseudomonas rustica]
MDKFRFLICTMVLCVGALFGLLFSGVNINSLSGWKDVFELLSYVATVGMAGFAIWTLDAWKSQFGFERRFDTLKELGDSFEDLRVIFKHIKHMKTYYVQRSAGDEDSALSQVLEELDRTGLMWEAAINRYSKVWRSSLFFITEEEFQSFSIPPHKLREKIKKDLVQLVEEVYDRKGPEVCFYIDFKMAGIHNELVEIFRETEVLLFKIIKKALSK